MHAQAGQDKQKTSLYIYACQALALDNMGGKVREPAKDIAPAEVLIDSYTRKYLLMTYAQTTSKISICICGLIHFPLI